MITIENTEFIDISDMPEVHKDERRTIYETIGKDSSGHMDRKTKIVITQDNALIGNHYHDFDEYFSGKGGGTIYTATKDNPTKVSTQGLPIDGWKLTISAGTIHAFRYDKGAVVISRANKAFIDGENTHSVVIAK